MSVKALANRPCTIITRVAGDVDDYGDETYTETEVETTCELQQIQRDEPQTAGELSVTHWLLILWDTSIDLDTASVVEVESVRYEMVGDPWVADSGSAAVHHIEATLIKADGS